MLTREIIRKYKQLPKWRTFYIIGPGKRLLDFGYIGPAKKQENKIKKFDKFDLMETVPSVSTILLSEEQL